jgi:hypothetical protein
MKILLSQNSITWPAMHKCNPSTKFDFIMGYKFALTKYDIVFIMVVGLPKDALRKLWNLYWALRVTFSFENSSTDVIGETSKVTGKVLVEIEMKNTAM